MTEREIISGRVAERQRCGHKSIICLILLLALTTAVRAQDDVRFDHITLRDGLSQATVDCILQDGEGFMWFGTMDGLDKYDGHEFTVYRPMGDDPNSLSDNHVAALCEDSRGNLWVGTRLGGLNRFEKRTRSFVQYKFDPGDPYSLKGNRVLCVFKDSGGALWVTTGAGWLQRYDPRNDRFEEYVGNPGNDPNIQDYRINQIFEDAAGNFYLVLGLDGLGYLNRETGLVELTDFEGEYPYLEVNRVLVDSRGDLWCATWGHGLFLLDKQSRVLRHVDDLNEGRFGRGSIFIRSLIEDSTGKIWLSTEGSGLIRFDPDGREFTQYLHDPSNPGSICSNEVARLYEDRTGTIWMGTLVGISKFNRFKFKFNHHILRDPETGQRASNFIFAIMKDSRGALWIGTRLDGLYRIDESTGASRRYDLKDYFPESENIVYSLFEDSKGRFYIGTSAAGLVLMDREKETFEALTEGLRVAGICEDSRGELWIATYMRGLGRYNERDGRFDYFFPTDEEEDNTLSSRSATVITEDRRGNLWIGTEGGGLNKLSPDRSVFTHYRHSPKDRTTLSDDRVLSIYEDEDGYLWVGTRSGLNKLNPKRGSCRRFYEGDVLPNNVVYGILPDDEGRLWMSTNKGLGRFDPGEETCRHFDIDDGLQENEFNTGAYFKSESGLLYFGGINGYNYFLPGQLRENPHAPAVALTALTILNEQRILEFGGGRLQEVVLNPDENSFSVEFAALDYAEPNRNRYSYKLEGLDKEWVLSGVRRYANYSRVPPGEYVFRVKGSNNDGVWSEGEAAIRITLIPPLWLRWEFQLLAALIGVAAVLAYHMSRMTGIRKQRDLLQREVEARTLELEHKNRDLEDRRLQLESANRELARRSRELEEINTELESFSYAVSHDLRSPLATINGYVNILSDEVEDVSAGRRHDFYRSITTNCKKMGSLIDGLLQFSRASKHAISREQVNLSIHVRSISNAYKERHPDRRMRLKVKNGVVADGDANLLGIALENIVGNALKYTAEREEAEIEFGETRQGGQRVFFVRDNGAGFDMKYAGRIFLPFERLHPADKFEGSGIGLATAQRIIRRHGGRIWAEGMPGEGATFFFTLDETAG